MASLQFKNRYKNLKYKDGVVCGLNSFVIKLLSAYDLITVLNMNFLNNYFNKQKTKKSVLVLFEKFFCFLCFSQYTVGVPSVNM